MAPTSIAALLEASGVDRSEDEIVDLVRGALAAPEAVDGDAWLDLIAPPDATALRAGLRALKAELVPQARNLPPVSARVAMLRKALAARGVDGMILPLTDEHRSEYIPASAKRLTWLTGFTGSAGIVAVLPERAALFVDGRYTIQAKVQLDPAVFERCHVVEKPPADWLGEHLRKGQRLGFDPRLHVKAEVERYGRACAKAGAELVALNDNPIDEVWESRPPPPIAPIRPLDDAYAGEASADKRARIGDAVGKAGADVAVLSAPDSIAWLLNLRGGDIAYNPLTLSFALLHADGAVELFVDQRKLAPGQNLGNGVSVQPIAGFADGLGQLGRDGKRVLVDPGSTSVDVTGRLAAAGATLIEGDEPCVLPKACKNPVELDGARHAQRRDGAALCRFLCWVEKEALQRSVDEMEAAHRLDEERRKDPLFRGLAFDTISAAGPNSALAHYRFTAESNRVLEAGSLYLTDSGGQYLDATTDVTRTIAIGEPSDEMRRRFTLVLKSHIAVDQALFPAGTNGAQLDGLARRPLWQAGLDFDHGTGHGIGSYLCVHEGPARIAKTGTVALKPGMILSNEPGYYKADAYGIRIENLVIVVPRGVPEGGDREVMGFENMTRAPIDRRLIVTALLDADERAWLDNYHATVRADLIDLLEGSTADWLVAATAPLE
jgi:Xaa-Pro aminopeptidase